MSSDLFPKNHSLQSITETHGSTASHLEAAKSNKISVFVMSDLLSSKGMSLYIYLTVDEGRISSDHR